MDGLHFGVKNFRKVVSIEHGITETFLRSSICRESLLYTNNVQDLDNLSKKKYIHFFFEQDANGRSKKKRSFMYKYYVCSLIKDNYKLLVIPLIPFLLCLILKMIGVE